MMIEQRSIQMMIEQAKEHAGDNRTKYVDDDGTNKGACR